MIDESRSTPEQQKGVEEALYALANAAKTLRMT
jgi:hypothetical protein